MILNKLILGYDDHGKNNNSKFICPADDLFGRIELTRAIVMLLDDWRIKPADQITLLALSRDTRPHTMRSYREHIPFPDDQGWRFFLKTDYQG